MDTSANQRVGEIVRHMRREKGLTQVTVASSLGVPQSYVSKIETGERCLRLSEVYPYADALGVDVLELVEKVGDNLSATA